MQLWNPHMDVMKGWGMIAVKLRSEWCVLTLRLGHVGCNRVSSYHISVWVISKVFIGPVSFLFFKIVHIPHIATPPPCLCLLCFTALHSKVGGYQLSLGAFDTKTCVCAPLGWWSRPRCNKRSSWSNRRSTVKRGIYRWCQPQVEACEGAACSQGQPAHLIHSSHDCR